MRKNIDISETTVKAFEAMALAENRSVKNMIETCLEMQGDKGITYSHLWYQCEAMSKQLKELSK